MTAFFHNALLAQLDPPRVETGNLRVADGRIVGVGSGVAALPGDEMVDCGGAVLMPGMVNGHTHLYSALAAGMPADDLPRVRELVERLRPLATDTVHAALAQVLDHAVAERMEQVDEELRG
jgi:cytosine/adenosine deaminase-related metal-dependent hydrolase